MSPIAFVDLLAQLPESYVYVHPGKLITVMALFAIWTLFAQWVDKDTIAVNTYRVLWNLVVLSAGAVAAVLFLFVPVFLIGLLLFSVINITTLTVYVFHRNGLMEPAERVFTPTHFRRLASEGFSRKKRLKEVTERVLLKGADRQRVAIPAGEVEREQYRLSQDLLFDALWRRSRIVELSPGGQVAKVIYEIDGVKIERESMERAEADAVLAFLKKIAGLDLEEHRKPQLNKISASVGEHAVSVVVRTDGTSAGEKLTLRVIGEETEYKKVDLGFTEKQMELVNSIMESPRGLVLFTAATESGLTTTIYSMARSHDAFLQNIQTLEYVKELEVNNITQRLFTPDDAEEKTFFSELQKIIRSDPDIIVLPELRERAAAELATQAASTKQKVYVGLGARDVFEALAKWMEMVGDNKLIAKSMLAVINQRLVRKLCTECKQPYKPDPQMLRKMNMPADKVLHRPPEPQFDKHGNQIICQNCQSVGYVGRSAVFDILPFDDGLRQLIAKGGSIRDIQSYAIKKGGVGLQQQALQKVLDGTTSIQEVARVIRGQKPGNSASAKRGAKPAAKPNTTPRTGSSGKPAQSTR
ncbi:MAG: Flp pilus assembly complex ATPase component TadA [Planctomycetes bacterium]|nr:Flp pilus assembly complex ATPase component TadA [Planctomycetota bacterium]